MRKFMIALLWISSSAVFAEEQITLSTAQLNNLGVKIGSLLPVILHAVTVADFENI